MVIYIKLVVIARIESAVMFKHETFKLPSGYWYRFAGFSFLEWVAFCHFSLVSLEGAQHKSGVTFDENTY